MKMERMYDFGRRHFGLTNYFAGTFFNSVVLFIPTVVLWIEKINIKCLLRVSPRSVGIGFSMWRTRSVYRLQKNRVRLRVVSKIKIPFIFWRAFWLLLRLELHKWIWMNAKRNGTWEIADHSSCMEADKHKKKETPKWLPKSMSEYELDLCSSQTHDTPFHHFAPIIGEVIFISHFVGIIVAVCDWQ